MIASADRRRLACLLFCAILLSPTRATRADVVLETRDVRLTIDGRGVCRGLLAKPLNEEFAWTQDPGAAFSVVRGKKTWPASSVVLADDVLTVAFGQANAIAKLKVIRTDDYVALRLVSIEGDPVDAVHVLRLRVKPLPYLGGWIDVAYSDAFGICLCGGNVKTDAKLSPPTKTRKFATMAATAYREVGLQGATAVLFGCPDPKRRFLDRMAVVERDFNLPRGAEHRRSPIQRYSYLWPSPTPGDIDAYVRWAKRGGFRMILFSYTAFTKGAGHFRWNSRYPNGMADLKRVADAVRQAGLAVGLHIHYNKAHKSDPYVTPVPDDRLGKVRRFTLVSAIDEKTGIICVNQTPKGCTLDDGRRILKAGKELIVYETYTTRPPYQFVGCKRGGLKTTPAKHAAGEEISLLDVDTWPIFIRFNQDTDIQDETARRLADIVAKTGPYDMVYFDGAEDVHPPFWYHCANAQWRVYRHFRPAPPVCEAAANTHFSWHMISRSNAYDSVPPPQMKAFCRQHPCKTAPRRAVNFTRIEFGWLHGFGRSFQSHITPDTLEYVLSRGAAWDCPFSMTVSLRELETNPRTESCFDVIKIWEDARIGQKLTDAQRERLKDLDQEHHLFVNEKERYELVAVDEVSDVAGGRALRAYTFRRPAKDNRTYALIWASHEDVDLTLEVPSDRVTAMRPFGKTVAMQTGKDKTTVAVGERVYLLFDGMDVARVEQILHQARSSAGVPVVIYRQAEAFSRRAGAMGLASAAGTKDPEAMGDCIVPTGPATAEAKRASYVEYEFDVPYKGRWHLSGRMRYRDTNSNSFFVAVADKPGTPQRFGNRFVWGEWLWDSPVTFKLDKGPVRIRVSIRESAPKVSPLLDVLCLTNDVAYKPSDKAAADQLAKVKAGSAP